MTLPPDSARPNACDPAPRPPTPVERGGSLPVTYGDVEAAARAIEGVAHRTPVLTSRTVDARTGCRVFFKCENLQRAGAFKFRGAYNALSRLAPEARRRGVLAYSSGNHAQAVALAGRMLGVPAVVVMPDDAPAVKRDATRDYGAEVLLYDPATQSREPIGEAVARERGLTLVPPFDHPHIVAGQGTAARELIEEVGPLDWLLVPVGGGGLISGCALAARALAPECRVVGVEPRTADDATRSFYTKTLQRVDRPETIADGARTAHLGRLTFPIILATVYAMTTATDAALVRAMRVLWERMKLVVEPTGVLGAAALFEATGFYEPSAAGDFSSAVAAPSVPAPGLADGDGAFRPQPGARVGVILSGGNADPLGIARLFLDPPAAPPASPH